VATRVLVELSLKTEANERTCQTHYDESNQLGSSCYFFGPWAKLGFFAAKMYLLVVYKFWAEAFFKIAHDRKQKYFRAKEKLQHPAVKEKLCL
jgi:hypothetical protein